MAAHKSPLSRKEKASGKFEEGNQGLSTKEKGKVVPLSEHVPSNRAYLKLSKAEFIAEMARLKERKLAVNKAAAEFDAKRDEKIEEIKVGKLKADPIDAGPAKLESKETPLVPKKLKKKTKKS